MARALAARGRQVPPLVAAGFRVLVPDQRGYGDSDRPDDVAADDIHHLTGDLVGLLDAFDLERAVFVGHDWGGFVVWMMPLLRPQRTAGVVGVNTPDLPRAPMPPVGMIRAAFGDTHYIVHFPQRGVADAALARDVRRVFTQLPPQLGDDAAARDGTASRSRRSRWWPSGTQRSGPSWRSR